MIIVQIAGRLGRDPESRFTTSGQKVTTITVATNVRKAGKEETVWWRVTVWGERYDKMMPYLKKGSAVIVVGEMNKPDIWTDKEGRPQVSLEITADILRFSPFGNPSERNGEQSTSTGTQQSSGYGADVGNAGGGGDYSAPAAPGASYGAQSSYGANNTAAPRYAQPSQAEEPLPF